MMDLAIVGGGPAGTAAALEARRQGMRVALWERSRFPRDKVCGEFLSAEALPLLEKEIPATLARAPVIQTAEFISRRVRKYAFRLPEAGRGLSRWLLDEALWRATALSGAEAHEGEAVESVARTPGGSWQVAFDGGQVCEARALMVACGRWWSLRGFPSPADGGCGRRARGRAEARPWLGAKAHFRGVESRRAVEMYFFPGGYCGLAPVEDGVYNACCLVHQDLAREADGCSPADFAAWIDRLARHSALGARLSGAVQVAPTVTTAAIRLGRRETHHHSALLVGDAAGFLDPFTGAGISMALNGGRLAAQALAAAGLKSCAPELAAARDYRHHLRQASVQSYRFAQLLRHLVSAPAEVQDMAGIFLAQLGPWLTTGTRWKA